VHAFVALVALVVVVHALVALVVVVLTIRDRVALEFTAPPARRSLCSHCCLVYALCPNCGQHYVRSGRTHALSELRTAS
jgi:hypothetical protein